MGYLAWSTIWTISSPSLRRPHHPPPPHQRPPSTWRLSSKFSRICRCPLPMARTRWWGPSTCTTILGIEVDSVAGELRLSMDKLSALQDLISRWRQYTSTTTKRDLQSLIGHLSFAAKVVPAGRIFIRRLIYLSITAPDPSSMIHLSQEANADIAWWQDFLPLWNGKALIRNPYWSRSPDMELYTDASGLGFGGYFAGQWFHGCWSHEQNQGAYAAIIWRKTFFSDPSGRRRSYSTATTRR